MKLRTSKGVCDFTLTSSNHKDLLKNVLVGIISLFFLGTAGMSIGAEGVTYLYHAHEVETDHPNAGACFDAIGNLNERFTATFASEGVIVGEVMAECFTTPEQTTYASFLLVVQALDEVDSPALEDLVAQYQGKDMHGFTLTFERVQNIPTDARAATLVFKDRRYQLLQEGFLNSGALPGYASLEARTDTLRKVANGNDVVALSDFLKRELSKEEYNAIRSSTAQAGYIGLVLSYSFHLEDGTQLDPGTGWMFLWDCKKKSCDLQ